ncbi:OmpA family protein [Pedobacter metabolipauper]|uniref:OOP family OmpA-OmpF porin n=1 Tax=Pedobacter metabolipauper TaxID=425513 RepID=A0A4V3D1P8_9SPHI|nr:OmpA family protein [Pedobacter metabolipauper]TDQ12023.1 OOP family OmpA-OmpF porin [Pedobacter metabolipauper]
MKSKITKAAMVLSLVGLSSQLFAQETTATDAQTTEKFSKKYFRTWSIGLNGGMLTHYTPFNNRQNGDFYTPQESWGYGGYIKKQIIPGFGIQADFLAGKVKGFRPNNLPGGATAAQQNAGFETSIDWSAAVSGNFTIANMSLNQKRNVLSPYVTAGAGYMSSSANTDSPTGASTGYEENWFVPIGAGFKLGLSKGVNIDLGYTVNFMKDKNFDGVVGAANDRFSYAHAGIEIALGRKGTSQLQNYSAIAAIREESAEENEKLRRALSSAEENARRDKEAMAAKYAQELGDDDNDGVANKFDKCPGTPANTVVDGAGCPLKTPAQIIREKVIVTEADRKVVDEAIRNLEFDLGKATLRPTSYATLNKVAELLVEKNFSLKLAGHTDNTGSMELNLRLSKDRAESVKAYLVSQGANASRVEATGYGPNQPIASNKTADGRQKNRRVEFSLF